MLHLFTRTIATDITQRHSFAMDSDAFPLLRPFHLPNTAANQPATGWFLFPKILC